MRALVLLFVLCGCSSPAEPPAKTTPNQPVVVESHPSTNESGPAPSAERAAAYLASIEGLAKLAAPERECAALSAEMGRYRSEHKAELIGEPAVMKVLNDDAQQKERLREAMRVLMNTSLRCQSDEAYQSMVKGL